MNFYPNVIIEGYSHQEILTKTKQDKMPENTNTKLNSAEEDYSPMSCYPFLVTLLRQGYSVELSPIANSDEVDLIVQEAKNGTVEGRKTRLCGMEWLFCEEGIAERLKEVTEDLIPLG